MKKNIIFPFFVILAAAIIVGLFIFLIKNKNSPPPDNTPIFFYGYDCPHCQKVEEFFAANDVTKKISFEQREVYQSANNAKLMTDRYGKCGITDPKEMYIPFYWNGTTCITGDQPIIDYFKNNLGL